jgi:Zn-dependent M28 family amino/carboxypeptidase
MAGIPVINFIQDDIEYETRTHHSTADTLDRVQPEDLKQAAAVVAAFVYQTATRDERLPRKGAPRK